MKNIITLCFCSIIVACGSSTDSSVTRANPCATPGATYLDHCVEESGNCGSIPDQVININSDGTLTSAQPFSCASVSQNGCVARDTDCTSQNDGVSCSTTFETTYMADGSSANSLETISCENASSSCVSTYSCKLTRQ